VSDRYTDAEVRELAESPYYAERIRNVCADLIAARGELAALREKCADLERYNKQLCGLLTHAVSERDDAREAARMADVTCADAEHRHATAERERADIAARYKRINDAIPADIWPCKSTVEAVEIVVRGYLNLRAAIGPAEAELLALRSRCAELEPRELRHGDEYVRADRSPPIIEKILGHTVVRYVHCDRIIRVPLAAAEPEPEMVFRAIHRAINIQPPGAPENWRCISCGTPWPCDLAPAPPPEPVETAPRPKVKTFIGGRWAEVPEHWTLEGIDVKLAEKERLRGSGKVQHLERKIQAQRAEIHRLRGRLNAQPIVADMIRRHGLAEASDETKRERLDRETGKRIAPEPPAEPAGEQREVFSAAEARKPYREALMFIVRNSTDAGSVRRAALALIGEKP
jgi:hypothetical protein